MDRPPWRGRTQGESTPSVCQLLVLVFVCSERQVLHRLRQATRIALRNHGPSSSWADRERVVGEAWSVTHGDDLLGPPSILVRLKTHKGIVRLHGDALERLGRTSREDGELAERLHQAVLEPVWCRVSIFGSSGYRLAGDFDGHTARCPLSAGCLRRCKAWSVAVNASSSLRTECLGLLELPRPFFLAEVVVVPVVRCCGVVECV